MASAEPEDSAQEVGWRPEKDASDWQHNTPPPEAEALTSDGQLLKLTLREGVGDLPPKHARCLGEGRTAPHRRGVLEAQRAGAAAARRGRRS